VKEVKEAFEHKMHGMMIAVATAEIAFYTKAAQITATHYK